MDLHVTLAAGPGVRLPGGEPTEEIVITRAHLASGEQLHEQLARRFGVRHLLVGGRPLSDLQPGVPPLTSGAVVVAAAHEHMATRPSRPSNLYFLVRSGPDAGKAVPLSRGTYTIGRSTADITIHDPELSREHAVLNVSNDTLTLGDRNSANGVWVDGCRVERTTVTTKSDIRIGTSRCALVLADAPPEPLLSVDLSEPCDVDAPLPPEGNRILVLTAFLPLVLGIVMAITTGMWFFLAFSALSAAAGLVPLINGRRKQRVFDAAVTAAVVTDSRRRRLAAPDAGGLTLAALRPGLTVLDPHAPQHSGGGYLRLGVADQPANIQARPKPPAWQPPVIAGAPVLIPLVEPVSREPINLDVRGPQLSIARVANLLLLQLSVLQEAGEILCYGTAAELPPAARFLRRVTLVAHRERFTELLATGRYSSVVLFGEGTVADAAGLRIYRFSSSRDFEQAAWTADYFPPEPVLISPGSTIRFRPDFVRTGTFDLLARANGTGAHSDSVAPAEGSVPRAVSLPGLITSDSESIVEKWRGPSTGAHLETPIGSSVTGTLVFDLVTDGPHLLVAGTTGSGKSEFLRTLVLGLALNYSPGDLNFLFIDFKGGSGLGGLGPLPHVTGTLTDLSTAAVSRALISLRAEVKRRETIFADAGAADYLEYRARTSVPLPRLVTVIDEFRMLSEEVPGAVHELMRIAALGRSLGMHLVLATQRPQGSITWDIRANITASVALRMQSAMESQDVLESAAASCIPVSLPGRGYLRVASGPPIEFQAATATAPGAGAPSTAVISFASFLTKGTSPDPPVESPKEAARPGASYAAEDAQALVTSANRAAQALPLPPLRAPVRPPLPATVTRTQTSAADVPELGLLDIPEIQEQRPLVWDPACHSHLSLVGQPGSGLRSVLSHIAAEHIRALPNRHLYLLDGDSSLRAVKDAPQVGAYVSASDIKRAARVIQRVAELMADRLNVAPGSPGMGALLTVFVTGWGRWASAFRSGRFAWAEDSLQDVVRDGEAAGVTVVIAGERELIASRFFSMVPNRLYLPVGASPEALLGWPKLPAVDPIPGRAFVQGSISAGVDAVAQLITEPGTMPSRQPAQRPFRVAVLPRIVSGAELKPAAFDTRMVRIPVGIGGDDLVPIHLVLPQRSAALVVGSAGTGKSQTLNVIAELAPPSLQCVRPASDEDPDAFWKRAAATGTDSNNLLLVDDADLLSRDTHHLLAGILATGTRAVFACSPSPTIAGSPALVGLRANPLGIVLGPRSATDGDIFGLRLDVDGKPPPGRGVLVDSGRSVEIQVAKMPGHRSE